MKHLYLLILLFVTAIGIYAQDEVDTTKIEIDNFYKVDDGVYRSKQPNKVQFQMLEDAGFTDVLNLRRFNSDDDEAKDTEITLHHIPVRASRIGEKQFLEALRIIKNRKGNILVHCHHGSDRTGGVIAMYRIVFQGWSKEDAIEEMKTGGYGFHSIYRNIPKTINNIDIEEFKEKLFDEN